MLRHAVLPLVAAALPLPAAAEPATWAQDRREPVCIYDGLIASAQDDTPAPSQMDRIRAECQQRFGWTVDQTNRGTMVAMVMIEMMQSQQEARRAGVEQRAIDAIRNTLTEADAASLGQPGEPVSEEGNATMRRIAERVLASGIEGDAGRAVTRAVVYQLVATRLIASFAQEVMTAPPS